MKVVYKNQQLVPIHSVPDKTFIYFDGKLYLKLEKKCSCI